MPSGHSREDFFRLARKRLADAVSSRDHLLIHSVSAIDELNKSSNLLFERLSEWYGIYFPEFKVHDNRKYVEGVLLIDKKSPDVQKLGAVFGSQMAQSIADKARSSVGTDFSEEDIAKARRLAQEVKALWSLRDEIASYGERLASELCPNLSHLAGPALAAKLVAQAGGLKRLSSMPASTIQVLGAEKALFKHLKTKSKPPKHGIIFQHPAVGMAPKKLRGKIARALSSKLAIAAKADAISKNFIADRLKGRFDLQVKRIMSLQGAKQKQA